MKIKGTDKITNQVLRTVGRISVYGSYILKATSATF